MSKFEIDWKRFHIILSDVIGEYGARAVENLILQDLTEKSKRALN